MRRSTASWLCETARASRRALSSIPCMIWPFVEMGPPPPGGRGRVC
nr:MAG TPA: hypothetical protein [Caudoviricetes sp.]